MKKNKKLQIKKEYLVIGSNNFWYASCDTSKEAKQIKKEVMKEPKDEVNYNYGNDEQCLSYHPLKPEVVYIYEAKELLEEAKHKVEELIENNQQ